MAFAETYWERRAVVLPEARFGCPFELDDVFAVGAKLWSEFDDFPRIRSNVFIDSRHVLANYRDYLPQPSDGDMAGYAERMDRLVGEGVDWMVMMCHTQLLDPSLYLRARRYLAPLQDALGGVPRSFCDIDMFVGNYRRTPFGVHQDTASNLMFTLEGTKIMRQWPPEYDAHPMYPNILPYDHLADDGDPLRGEAGSIVYWPSSYWHVGEQPEGFAVTANLVSYYEDGPILQAAESVLGAALPQLPDPVRVEHVGGRDGMHVSLPAIYTDSLDAFAAALADGSARRALLRDHLVRLSSGGFWGYYPDMAAIREVADGELLVEDPALPVLVAPESDDRIIVAANGHLREVHAALAPLLQRLREAPAAVGDLLDALPVDAVLRDDARQLLAWLVAARGLHRPDQLSESSSVMARHATPRKEVMSR